MFKTIAIVSSAALLMVGIFGFLGFQASAGTSCGFACPLTQGVLAFSAFFSHSLGGSTFVILLLVFSLAIAASFAVPVHPRESNFIQRDIFKLAEACSLVFQKITFWFSLHEASPAK